MDILVDMIGGRKTAILKKIDIFINYTLEDLNSHHNI